MAGLKRRPHISLLRNLAANQYPRETRHASIPWTRPFTHTTTSCNYQQWTPAELQILKQASTSKLPIREIHQLLPHRSPDAIRTHRHRQGLATRTRRSPVTWTDAETARLREALEGGMSYWEVKQEMLQHRTVSALRARMNRLVLEEEQEEGEGGVKRKVRWRGEDVERVRELREREGLAWMEIAGVVGRSEVAVRNKYESSRLRDRGEVGARRKSAAVPVDGEGGRAMKQKMRWRREDVEQMRLLRDAKGLSFGEIAREMGRSYGAVRSRYLARDVVHKHEARKHRPTVQKYVGEGKVAKRRMRWPPQDLETLRVLREQKKLSWGEIGRAMGRSPDAVRVKYVDVFRARSGKDDNREKDEGKSSTSKTEESGHVKKQSSEG